MKEKRAPILGDHVRKGKKLKSPFLHWLGDRHSPYSWVRQIAPELIWIALLIRKYDLRTAIEIANQVGLACAQGFAGSPKPLFAMISSFSQLCSEEKDAVVGFLEPSQAEKLRQALAPLRQAVGIHPLSFICGDFEGGDCSTEGFGDVLRSMYDKHSRNAVLSIATAVYMGITQEKILHAPDLHKKRMQDFKDVVDYPHTEKSKAAAGAFRASASMFLYKNEGEGLKLNGEEWVYSFWEHIAGYGDCISSMHKFREEMKRDEIQSDDTLEKIVVNYRNTAKDDLKYRLDRWHLNLNELEKFEVVGALLARQTTLAIEIAIAPTIWTPHIAPILLRSMADVFITLAWILQDPNARSIKFIEDGLGAIKLENAHRKREIETTTDPEKIRTLQLMHDYWDEWMRSQKMSAFIEINLGSWSGLSARKMAEEAGFLDFYNYVYQPFSAAVHSNWAHISDKNSVICENPAHRMHRIPAIVETGLDPYWLWLAEKYLQKTFAHFDQATGVEPPTATAYDTLYDALYGGDEESDELRA
jgi:Family of unknown function (DUF5677)